MVAVRKLLLLIAPALCVHAQASTVREARPCRADSGIDLKITLDAQKVEQIITKGRQANATPAAVAQQIVRSATVLEKRETRILRALLDDDGRGMFNYQTDYYKPALMALVSKGLVQRQDKGFALTPEGMRVTKEYLTTVLESGTAAASSGSAGQNSGS